MTDRKPIFELSGDALCLDYANSWEDRSRPGTDKLLSYQDLLAFSRQAGSTGKRELDLLSRDARRRAPEARAAFEAARQLREVVYSIFSASAAGAEPEVEDLARLNEALALSLCHLRIERRGAAFAWHWHADRSLTAPLRPIVRSAADLLVSDRLDRLRECDGARCTWLFLDGSRNRSRRWCSMDSCGNRAKARRHYRRRRFRGVT